MSLDAMKQALAVLEEVADEVFSPYDNKLGEAILALRAAIEQAEKPHRWQRLAQILALRDRLAQPEQEPVAWFTVNEINEWAAKYLEKHPDQEPRQWQGLTDEEVSEILDREIGFNSCFGPETDFARAIEAKLREKNT